MAENTGIEWAKHTFNPWLGCTKVGPGCDHCYAEALAKRTGWKSLWGPHAPRRRTKDWSGPRKWQREAVATGERPWVFSASMADIFDNQVPPEWRADYWQLVRETPNLNWIIVTKRIGNVQDMVPADWPFPHVGLVSTIVNQTEADRDIPKLLATPAAWRGISAEPLLGPIMLDDIVIQEKVGEHHINALFCEEHPEDCEGPMGSTTLDWVIVGGESGANARPMHPEWARSIRDQCAAAEVPFFFKQWGAHAPASVVLPGDHLEEDRDRMLPVSKKAAGRLLDGITWDEMPAIPAKERV